MRKPFREVFPALSLSGDAQDSLSHASVTRLTLNKGRDLLHVYLESDRLIEKKIILEAERAIERGMFSGLNVKVKIIERFFLSEQYTAQNLLPMYEESILLELKNYSEFLYDTYRHSGREFTASDSMTLRLPDTCVARARRRELEHILEKIFTERCGQNFHLTTEFIQEEGESRNRQLEEKRLEMEVAQISRRVYPVKAAEASFDDDEFLAVASGGSPSGSASGTSAGRSGFRSARKGSAASPSGNSQKDRAGESYAEGKKAPAENGAGNTEAGISSKGTAWRRSGAKRSQGARPAESVLTHSDDPDVIYGRDVQDDAIELKNVIGEMGEITVRGQVRRLEFREIRNERTIVMMDVTDFTDTITIKLFFHNEQAAQFKEKLSQGDFVKIKGVTTIDRFDSQLTIGSVRGIRKISDFRIPRMDTWPEKRVELHCHTKMSNMDGVSDVKDIVQQAMRWGHEAIAITDHGSVQAFPDANHTVPKDSPFKVIYGCEGYLVDDVTALAVNSKGQSLNGRFVVFDLETTGFSPVKNRIIEIGAVLVENGEVTRRFSTFVNPKVPIPYRIEQLTSINDSMVMDAPPIGEVLPKFLKFCEGAVLVAHNASFDVSFIIENCERLGIEHDFTAVDTVGLARVLLPKLNRFKLDTVAKALGVSLGHHHRAVDDAECTAHIFERFVSMLRERDIFDLDAMNELGRSSEEQIRKLPTYHVILLAKNDEGRLNLYRLVSESHVKYFNRRPRIPKSLLSKHRNGILIGSACEAGEVYQAIERGLSDQALMEVASFYDYLEIQPVGNNLFLTKDDREEPLTIEDLRDNNRRIVRLGEQLGKLVAATCDVHFLNPEDEVYRRIIQAGEKFSDADEQPPLFLHTTREMLEEFSYLGEDKAHEVVISNTRKIADMCERIEPVRPDKCPPVIENSDGLLTKICYDKAHEMYGDPLPAVVEERLKRELTSIISNGYAVMYIIAQKLVWKSRADGYLVGSRGSVGSSFVATMSGITEVNPLHPHYRCPKCHFVDFDSPEVRKFDGMAGCDMPDRNCPNCGTPLLKDGFDIPFETFLGFKGNKEPDIDLNFSGEYQSKAHHYTAVIFGDGQTFRAGTTGTLADKTAFGFVKNYYEEKGDHKRICEINRIVEGCTGVLRTTGQHPGGIIVMPYGEEINSFTPVQHPADDMTSTTITTHFDYHSIDHNLLKLDILGHDDPTMIHMLEDLTGLKATDVPLDDRKVMSLFQNTSALGITPEQIGGTQLGCLGVPEFGTEFAMQMLMDTKPQYLSDLVRIAGLAHGTDVWLGNAQTLIQEGRCTISTAICCRDDIMVYLISKGLDKEQSFMIMEHVRKGKGLKMEEEKEMTDHGVPDWYIWSCKKIKYMFPKAHAAAYVMMAWRIAWFKIYQPLAFYAAFFSIRSPGFDYEMMCLGEEKLQRHIDDYEKRKAAEGKEGLQKKELDELRAMYVVREMYERGCEFCPIDIFKARAAKCQIVDGKIMPALSMIGGMGDQAAASIVEACKDGPFLSRDDFRERTKVSKTIADKLVELNILKDLPESNQLSIFDFTGGGE